MFHSWNQTFRIVSFLWHSLNINLAWCWEQHEGQLIWPCYIFPIMRCPDFMIITRSFLPFSVVFSNQGFSNCSVSVGIGFFKLYSDCFCRNRVFRMNVVFCCHLAAVVAWFLHTVLFNVWQSLSGSLGFWPLFFLAEDVSS
jgi:hypothetical protein